MPLQRAENWTVTQEECRVSWITGVKTTESVVPGTYARGVSGPDGASAPVPLVGASVLVGLEGLVLVGLAVVELVNLTAGRVTLAVTTALFFLALGGGLLACARGLVRVSSWARGPVVASQLIGLLLSVSFWGGETTPVAVVILLVSALTLVGVLHPASTRALAADSA